MRNSIVVLISIILFLILPNTNYAQKQKVTFVQKDQEKKIDILIDNNFFTSFCWYDHVYKPVFYPVVSEAGAEITRGFPLNPRENERVDHLHQVGLWFNYGNVNGFDFWGNGSTGKKSPNGGEIKHLSIEKLKSGEGQAEMISHESWQDPSGKELLKEKTIFHFYVQDHSRIIDRVTKLTATSGTAKFKDSKEGMFAIRVARQLELLTKDTDSLYRQNKSFPVVRANTNYGVTGNYLSSEGKTGSEVWGTRARWMNLYGKIGEEKISILICDHPKNQGFPTYWHARDYGLFAANPLGGVDFANNKDSVNFSIPKGQSKTFRYRIIFISGNFIKPAEAESWFADFRKKY
jgi:hypothetical protein